MVKKEDMNVEVDALKKRLSESPEIDHSTTSETVATDTQTESLEAETEATEASDNAEIELKDVANVLKEHGVEIDDLKGLWDQITTELRDLPTEKPLVTALGAFLIGFLAGRMSRR